MQFIFVKKGKNTGGVFVDENRVLTWMKFATKSSDKLLRGACEKRLRDCYFKSLRYKLWSWVYFEKLWDGSIHQTFIFCYVLSSIMWTWYFIKTPSCGQNLWQLMKTYWHFQILMKVEFQISIEAFDSAIITKINDSALTSCRTWRWHKIKTVKSLNTKRCWLSNHHDSLLGINPAQSIQI